MRLFSSWKKPSTPKKSTYHRRSPWQIFTPRLELLEDRTLPSVFTVINTLDDGSTGSLRWAITQANADADPLSTINFNIGTGGAQSIALSSALPAITHSVLLDGWTQPVYNAAADFVTNLATATNPSGVWKYGWSTTPTAPLTLYTKHYEIGPNNDWNDPNHQVFGVPTVYKNTGSELLMLIYLQGLLRSTEEVRTAAAISRKMTTAMSSSRPRKQARTTLMRPSRYANSPRPATPMCKCLKMVLRFSM